MEYAPSTCATGGFSHQERLGLDGGSSTGQVLWRRVGGWGSGHGWRGVPVLPQPQRRSGGRQVFGSCVQEARHAGSSLPALAGAGDSPASTPRSDGSRRAVWLSVTQQ